MEFDPEYLICHTVKKTQLSDKFFLEVNGTETGKVHIAMAGVAGIGGDYVTPFQRSAWGQINLLK